MKKQAIVFLKSLFMSIVIVLTIILIATIVSIFSPTLYKFSSVFIALIAYFAVLEDLKKRNIVKLRPYSRITWANFILITLFMGIPFILGYYLAVRNDDSRFVYRKPT